MSKSFIAAVAVAVALPLSASTASAAVITFTADTTGAKPNGFVSNESSEASFSDTSGADLQLQNWAHQSFGNALAVFGDDTSRLAINFTSDMGTLTISFGNDDPGWAGAGDRAWLQLYHGTTLVATVSTVMNLNDNMDQIVTYAGAAFNNALFWYGDAAGAPIGLIEIVDNITFDAAVPEPASMLLLGTGLVGAAMRRRRQKRA